MELLRRFGVLLIDMGHTHYNEISNDGRTLYSATRSTGQIEEGPVGYSITNIDGGVMSWRFVELGKLPVVIITSPGDERLMVESNPSLQPCCNIRAKFWGELKAIRATATLNGNTVLMSRVEDSLVWEAQLDGIPYGIHPLKVVVEDAGGHAATDEIRIAIGDRARPERAERDQDNALGAWPEHGLVGTQLGPNKNGKKW
jgi:hypothetical protein